MSLDHPVLDQVVLGASTLFDVKRAPYASHLTVFPQRPDEIGRASCRERVSPRV